MSACHQIHNTVFRVKDITKTDQKFRMKLVWKPNKHIKFLSEYAIVVRPNQADRIRIPRCQCLLSEVLNFSICAQFSKSNLHLSYY